MTSLLPSVVLRGARKQIEERGWWSAGGHGEQKQGRKPVCLDFALINASLESGILGSGSGFSALDEARKLLADTIVADETQAPVWRIAKWNDEPGRTRAEALALLDAAADKAEAAGV